MNTLRFHPFILVALGLAGLCSLQSGRQGQGDLRSRAETLAQYCSPEFDDPATPEYKQCTQAIQIYERLAAQKPEDVSVFLALGRILENRSHEKAIDAFKKALAIDPGNVSANFELGVLLDSPAQQIQHFRAVLAAEPNHPQAHGRLARLLAVGGETDEAVTETKRQIEINPDQVDVIADIMQALAARGKKTDAAQVLIAYLRSGLPAKVKCDDNRFLSKEYADQPDVAKAIKEQCPGSDMYADALRQKDPRERARLLEAAIDAGNVAPLAYAELALALLQINEVDRAMAAINQQVRLNPVLGHDQIVAFAASLQKKSLINDAIKVYSVYLESSAPNEFVCEPARQFLADPGVKSRALEQSFQKRCGAFMEPH